MDEWHDGPQPPANPRKTQVPPCRTAKWTGESPIKGSPMVGTDCWTVFTKDTSHQVLKQVMEDTLSRQKLS